MIPGTAQEQIDFSVLPLIGIDDLFLVFGWILSVGDNGLSDYDPHRYHN